MSGLAHGGCRPWGLAGTLVAVAGYGALVGALTWTAIAGQIQAPYPLPRTAAWIAHPGADLSQSYYRQEIHLTGAARRVWVQVTAPNAYTLYVNETRLTTRKDLLGNVSGVHDLTPWLHPGKNVVGVEVARLTYPGTSRLAIAGEIEDAQGRRSPVASGGAWRVAPIWRRQPGGGPPWHVPAFDASGWTRAVVLGPLVRSDLAWIEHPAWVVTERLTGAWAWLPDSTSGTAHLRHHVDLPSGPQEAWMRVATHGAYGLFVNGVLVAEREGRIVAARTGAPTPLPAEAYDLAPYLGRGANVIALAVRARPAERRVAADALILERSGRAHRIATPIGWTGAASVPLGRTPPDAAAWAPLAGLGPVTQADGEVPAIVTETRSPGHHRALVLGQWAAAVLVSVAAAIGVWLATASWRARVRGTEVARERARGALPFALAAIPLLGACLLAHDPRFGPTLPYRSLLLATSLGLVLVAQGALFLSFVRSRRPGSAAPPRRWPARLAWWTHGTVLAATVLVGLLVRLHEIDYRPLNWDEAAGMLSVQGIFERGYPHHRLSEHVTDRASHSSELVGYPKAAAVLLLGASDVAARLPAALFGTVSILLLYALGRDLFDRRVGLLAALILAFLPAAIAYSQHSRYPAQLQCFAILTVHFFYRSIATTPARTRPLAGAFVAFALAFLSWEASVFLLTGLFVGLVLVRRPDVGWLREGRLWLALGAAAVVILVQQALRTIALADWTLLGTGFAEVTLAPLWLYPYYDPLGVFQTLLLAPGLQLVSAGMLAGLLASYRERPLAYLGAVLTVPLLLIAHVLEAQLFRHVFYLLPPLVLLGARALFLILDGIVPQGVPAVADQVAGAMARAGRLAVVGLLLLTTNPYVLQLRDLPVSLTPDVVVGVGDDGWVRSAAAFVSRNAGAGDPVIARDPDWLFYYLRRADYMLRTRKLPAEVSELAPIPVDTKGGLPILFDLREIRAVLNRSRSAWIVSGRNFGDIDPDIVEFVQRNATLAFEDYGIQVYHWSR